MIPLSPALFLAAARTVVTIDMARPNPSRSKRQRLAQLDPIARETHGPHDGVTTAAFIGHVGHWAHREESGISSWPFPVNADCDELARLGMDRGVVGMGTPDPGAIYLRWSVVERRFVRAGLVLWVKEVEPEHSPQWTHDLHLLEGSATPVVMSPSLRSGTSSAKDTVPAERTLEATVHWARHIRLRGSPCLGDRFLSWVDLDGRNATTDPNFHLRVA